MSKYNIVWNDRVMQYLYGPRGKAAWTLDKNEAGKYSLAEANQLMEYYNWRSEKIKLELDETSLNIEYSPSKRALR